jgi:excisionase family DNA binding protein
MGLTLTETADRLKRSKSTVTRYVALGLLRCERFGQQLVFKPSEVERFRREKRFPRRGNPAFRKPDGS